MNGFRVLLPGSGTVSAADYVDGLGLRGRAGSGRPYLVLNMVVSLDGHAAVAGRTAPLANAADQELFHELRRAGDAVLVGAGTIRSEGYGQLDQLAVIASRRLDLPTDRGVLTHRGNRVAVVTESNESLPDCEAAVRYLRCGLADALVALRRDDDVRSVVCEGGPHLNSQLLAAGLVDEMFVTIGGRVFGGDPDLTLVAGPTFDPPIRATPIALLERDGFLFARYRLGG